MIDKLIKLTSRQAIMPNATHGTPVCDILEIDSRDASAAMYLRWGQTWYMKDDTSIAGHWWAEHRLEIFEECLDEAGENLSQQRFCTSYASFRPWWLPEQAY